MNGTEFVNGIVRLKSDSTGPEWMLTNDGTPLHRARYAFSYDSARDLAIFFSGIIRDDIGIVDTWVYDYSDDNWTQMYPANSPSERMDAAMAYDSRNNMSVLFGGNKNYDPNKYRSDVYTYNSTSNNWTLMNPATKPPPRSGHGMVYNERDGVFIVFGGFDASRQFNDTWTYNLTTNTWTNWTTPDAPAAREYFAMAYDSGRGAVVLFGGYSTKLGFLDDTWLYYPSNNTWEQMQLTVYPVARVRAAIAYDASSGRSVMFGGRPYSQSYEPLNDTWAYDSKSNTWTNISQPKSPFVRDSLKMVYNTRNRVLIIFGGLSIHTFSASPDPVGDTWSFNPSNGTWNQMDPFVVPGYRGTFGMDYDPGTGLIVLLGGRSSYDAASSVGVSEETWTYNSTAGLWRQSPKNGVTSPSYQACTVFDERAGLFVQFGAWDNGDHLNLTWTYCAGNDTWTEMETPTGPPSRDRPAISYDSKRGTILLFGGYSKTEYLNDTWSYDLKGNLWTKINTTRSPPGDYYATGYDPLNDKFVVYGCYGFATWVFDPGSRRWSDITPSKTPPSPKVRSMAYDRTSGLVTLIAGDTANETWGYDCTSGSWSQRSVIPWVFDSNHDVGIAYDNANGVLVFLGWDLEGTTWTGSRHYAQSGDFTSVRKDTGGRAYFGNLSWTGFCPPGGHIRFQLRTAATEEELLTARFLGPDGTGASYYEECGQRISDVHNGSRWVQYRAYLYSGVNTTTPVIWNVSIGFNLLQSLRILSPAGYENWTGVHDISWAISDADNDGLSIDVHLLGDAGSSLIAANLSGPDRFLSWDTAFVPNGTYAIRLVARDNNTAIPLSVEETSAQFVIFHPPPPNHMPTATLLSPAGNALIDNETVRLSWGGFDPDGDTVSYFILVARQYFTAADRPRPVAETSNTSYMFTGLVDGESYYWTVIPNDGIVNGTMPDPRGFTVDLPLQNHAPAAELVSPADNATLNTTTVVFGWQGSDADGDNLFYYLIISDAPLDQASPLRSTILTITRSMTLTNLTNGTVYYWTVVPNDGKGNGSSAPARKFLVDITLGNNPPRIISRQDVEAIAGLPLVFNITARDPDGDRITFSLVNKVEGMAIDSISGRLTWAPDTARVGFVTVTVRVTDSRGATTEQQLTITVRLIPGCTISYPPDGQMATGRITVRGVASSAPSALVAVQFRVDGGQWKTASGTVNWTFELDASELPVGTHFIEARAWDGTLHSNTTSVRIIVKHPSGTGATTESIPAWMIVAIVVSAAACVAAGVLLRRRANR